MVGKHQESHNRTLLQRVCVLGARERWGIPAKTLIVAQRSSQTSQASEIVTNQKRDVTNSPLSNDSTGVPVPLALLPFLLSYEVEGFPKLLTY